MSFPIVFRELKEMVPKTALQTRWARAIARKAGLRMGAGRLPLEPRPVTLVDAFVVIGAEAFVNDDDESGTYMWRVDFTPFTHARVSSSNDWEANIAHSPTATDEEALFTLFDWEVVTGTYDLEPGHPFNDEPYQLDGVWENLGFAEFDPRSVGWVLLPEEYRRVWRIAPSTSGNPGSRPLHQFDSGPFAFSIQAISLD